MKSIQIYFHDVLYKTSAIVAGRLTHLSRYHNRAKTAIKQATSKKFLSQLPENLQKSRCKSFDPIAAVATKLIADFWLITILTFMPKNIQISYLVQPFIDSYKST
jgi:hypothetical protein